MPTCTQAAPLTQRAMVSQGPALFVLGGGQLLRGRRLLDELAALSGVSGLWWRHVGGIAPKGGLALAHARLTAALERAARSAHGQRARAHEPPPQQRHLRGRARARVKARMRARVRVTKGKG